MQFGSTLNPGDLKVGDIISLWSQHTARETLGMPTDLMELERHIIIDRGRPWIKTAVLYHRKGIIRPGVVCTLDFHSIRTREWKKLFDYNELTNCSFKG